MDFHTFLKMRLIDLNNETDVELLESFLAAGDARAAFDLHRHNLASQCDNISVPIETSHCGSDTLLADPNEMFTFSEEDSTDEAIATNIIDADIGSALAGHLSRLKMSEWALNESSGLLCSLSKDLAILGRGASSVVVAATVRHCSGNDVPRHPAASRCVLLQWEHFDGQTPMLTKFNQQLSSARLGIVGRSPVDIPIVRCFGVNVYVGTTNSDTSPKTESATFDEIAQPHALVLSVHELGRTSLAAHLARLGSLPPSAARSILVDIVQGLVYLHCDRGVVHGDVKPQNVLLIGGDDDSESRWKLSDFEMSQSVERTIPESQHVVGGTVVYMSPRASQGIVHPSNDVWSVGVLGIQLLTGRVPWAPLEAQFPSILLAGLRSLEPSTTLRPQLEEVLSMARAAGDKSFTHRLVETLTGCFQESSDMNVAGTLLQLLTTI